MSNTAVRVLVSFLAIPFILLLAYLGEYYFFSFVLIISIISFIELSKLSETKGSKVNIWWGSVGIFGILLNSLLNYSNDTFFLVSIWFLILVLIELYRNKSSEILNVGLTSFGFLFFSISGYYLIKIRELFLDDLNFDYTQGGYLIISIFITIWICDSAAFFGGTKFGKHKLFPRVSPNKSWEGAIFGFVGSILSMYLLDKLLLNLVQTSEAIVVGIIIGTIGQIGDLVESLFKRDAGVKDSSNLIPGHGGVFDRFDSLFFSAPFIYFYLKHSLIL